MPCDECARRNNCREICPRLEAFLPRLYNERSGDEDMRLVAVLRRRGATDAILELRGCLEGREREIVDLVFNGSRTFEEAAYELGISVRGARRLLRLAYMHMAGRARRGRGARRNA